MIEQRLNLEQTQKLVVTQELRQAIELLTMPLLELEAFIEEQLQENPILEQDFGDDVSDRQEDSGSPEVATVQEEKDTAIQDLLNRQNPGEEPEYDWEKIAADWQENSYSRAPVQEQVSHDYEPVEMQYTNLYQYLEFQLNLADVLPIQERIGRFIISNLSRDGYLLLTPEKMAAELEVDQAEVEKALNIIRSFDPPGIGGINLQQCLLFQLDKEDPNYNALRTIIENYLDMVASNRLPQIAKKMKMPVQEVQALVDMIRTLNPRPGSEFADSAVVEYIYPDVVIEKVEDEFVVVVNDSTIPKVGINSFYLKLIREDDNVSDEAREFIKEKLNSAAWIVKGIEQRRATIYHIAEAIIELQHDFFAKGPDFLVPLNLSNVAEAVGVHESTVSRAISNKFVQTPHGLFPFKHFFVNGIGDADDYRSSVTHIKGVLKALVEKEDPGKPLNDEKLADLLEAQGISISRRTVAKYRKDLGILSAGKRKRF
ncbi:MAG: RNA polymerase factor sigma-54 [Bacillota bacterium]|nr:RNA polymerase factor sigma-54 [Bacillota bacterium]